MRDEQAHPFEIATRQLPSPLLGHKLPKTGAVTMLRKSARKIAKTTRDVKMFDVL